MNKPIKNKNKKIHSSSIILEKDHMPVLVREVFILEATTYLQRWKNLNHYIYCLQQFMMKKVLVM